MEESLIFFQVTVGPIYLFTLGASISDIHIVHLGFVCFLIKIIKKILVQITRYCVHRTLGGKFFITVADGVVFHINFQTALETVSTTVYILTRPWLL